MLRLGIFEVGTYDRESKYELTLGELTLALVLYQITIIIIISDI